MEKNLKARFKQRADTAANWAAKNPVLLQGEIGCESDTGNLKIGDGTKAWNDLAYVKEKLAKVATSGSYNDLSNKPTIPSVPGSLKNPYALTFTGAVTGSYDGSAAKSVAIPIVDSALSASSTNAIQNKVVNTALAGKANKATTLAGYGITDAKIASGVITLGGNTITPLTSHQSLAAYAKTADINTALAKKADKASALTNQNLNDIKTDGDYYAGGDNTVTNKPSGIDAFGLTVYHTANGYITQDLVEGNTNPQKRYTRQFNAQSWSAWIAMPTFTANPASGQVLVADGTLGGIKTSGYTIASSVPANAKFTDTNTWRGIQNNLTSDSASDSLAAAQGKALKTLVDGKAAKATTLAGYGITDAKISGGVITLGNNTITPLTSHQSLANYYTKDNVDTLISNLKAGLVNVVDSLPTTGENGKLYLVKTGTEDKNVYTEYVYVNSAWEKLGTQKLDLSGYLTKTDAASTYLGKTAAAASANKLNTNAGSATQPVYFANGVPVATTYTLGKSVPSNAVFTDTNNKVTQTAVADADYTNYRPLVWGASNSGTKGFTPSTVTDGVFTSKGLYVQPSTGLVHATTFEGNLTGTASNAAKVNNLTVQTAVPANAKFTDTVYTHPATHAASMITGLATVATSGKYSDLSGIPTSLPANGGTATKLSTSAGSATQPIYFSDGKPVACTYTLGKSVPSDAKFTDTNTWRGVQNNLTSTATDQSLSAAQGKYLNENKATQQNWTASIKCATWSRLCNIAAAVNVIGSSFILNIAATRGNVVYNETFAINVNHSSKATIAKLGTANYSSVQLRVIADANGNCYVEVYDTANSATNTTTQSVTCRLLAFRTGTITVYTAFTDGSTIPTGFVSAASITTNGNSLQGNLTWGEITGKPSSYTPASHTHSEYAKLASDNNLISHSNEFNFVNSTATAYNSAAGTIYINYRLTDTSSPTNKIKEYRFADGSGNNLAKISAASFNGYTIASNVPANAKFTDTVYTLPDATSSVKGGIKVGSNLTVSSGTLSLTKANVTAALGYTPPTTNTDTHWTTGLKVGASATATANAAATNGNVYLNVLDNTTVRDSHNIVGSGATTVTSDANGKITISSTNTVYTHPSSHPASMITGLATVATSGKYSDLSGTPTLGSAASKGVLNITTKGTLNWADATISGNAVPTVNTLAYWNGAYNNTNSNLAYCSQGAFGTIVTKNVGDYATATHVHNYAGSSSAGGAANSATKLATARTISLGTGATGTATSFDGTGNITIPVTAVRESYLGWGGKNFSGTFGCIDAAMVPNLGANRMAFGKAAGIKVEYSTDGGSTWTDYGLTDIQKIALFGAGGGAVIGKASASTLTTKCMLRVTVDTDAFGLYTVLNKFVIYLSTNGCTGTYCTIDASLENTPTTFKVFADKIPVAGWSGYNVINTSEIVTFGNTKTSQYGLIRFTFGCTGIGSSATPMNISRIMGFGGVGWSVPSNMARNGHLYSYDNSQNATFPAQVTATQFNGALNGKANTLNLSAGSTDAARFIIFQDANNNTSTLTACYDADFKYNPVSNVLTVGSVNSANVIKSLAISGKTITVTKGNGTTSTLTTQDTNTTYGAATSSALGLVKVGSNITVSSGTISLTKDNVTTALGYTPPTTNTTYSNMKGATSSAAGSAGLAPAPSAGAQGMYLRGDGTWATPTNTTYGAATASALGLVKIGSNITLSSGTISLSKANVTTALGYTPPTTNTTYSNMTAATASAAGKAGLVPAPAAGAQTKFLRGDGTWQNVDTSSAKVKMVVY